MLTLFPDLPGLAHSHFIVLCERKVFLNKTNKQTKKEKGKKKGDGEKEGPEKRKIRKARPRPEVGIAQMS